MHQEQGLTASVSAGYDTVSGKEDGLEIAVRSQESDCVVPIVRPVSPEATQRRKESYKIR